MPETWVKIAEAEYKRLLRLASLTLARKSDSGKPREAAPPAKRSKKEQSPPQLFKRKSVATSSTTNANAATRNAGRVLRLRCFNDA